MIVDLHTHVYDIPDYVSMLAETSNNVGFDKLCIGGGEQRYGLATNETVLEDSEAYPELFLPFAFLRPGMDGPAEVERMKRDGFHGLKVGAPLIPYDSPEFLPVLQAAEALRLPVLFHTGIMPSTPLDRSISFNADLARPVHLDMLARRLPGLKIIGTGLGGPWFEEAAVLTGLHGNVFFDLSGIQLMERGANFFKMILGGGGDDRWDMPSRDSRWKQIVFGTASKNKDICFVERDYQRLFRALALPDAVITDVMGKNAMRLFEG